MPNGNKPMYQPWNEEEFEADFHVQAMNFIQKWAYRALLQKSFFISTRPGLPNDDNILWALAGCESKQMWLDNMEPVRAMFKERKGLLFNKRVLEDYENWESRIENMQKLGRAGGQASAEARGLAYGQASKEVSKKEREVRKGMQKAQFPETKISAIWEEITGRQCPENKQNFKKQLKELIRVHGEDSVLSNFEVWAGMNQSAGFKRPVSAFIKQYSGTATVNGSLFNVSEINDLAVELSYMSDGVVTFNRLNLNDLAVLMRDFSRDEIIAAFKKFYSETEQSPEWMARDFVQKAPQFILVSRLQKEREKEQKLQIEQLKSKIQSDAAVESVQNEQARSESDELIQDAVTTFGLDYTTLKSTPSEENHV